MRQTVFLALLVACTIPRPAATKPTAEDYFPPPESQGGWSRLERPEDIRKVAGMDPDKLAALRQWLLDSDQRNFAAVVIRRGQVVLEVERNWSARTATGQLKSCSKAICATVLAIASEESRRGRGRRRMSFDDRAFDFIPWAFPLSDPRKEKITVKQLLNHTSGITPEALDAPNGGSWEYQLGHSGDPRTAKLAFDPGTASGYSTIALAHAALVAETVSGVPYDQLAIRALLKPIGVEHWEFKFFKGGDKYGLHPSHDIGLPARDMARIAYCMLRGGRWKDKQVIPKWFVEETAAPTHKLAVLEMRFKIDARTFSHGWELPAWLPGAPVPADARHKPGSGGNQISFIPSLDLVIVRHADGTGPWEFREYVRRAADAVLSAKPD